ncbi:hypothetical protein NPIL_397031 [Nephila pilipes]|uniref:Uncharacterized protein n=1 Tax=Nephila pilipes TaxID=299642 RepID=A0A8X6MSZ6_NEPPI|nr:hypothetical protein NPIL_397031 [Nephila pilipes]
MALFFSGVQCPVMAHSRYHFSWQLCKRLVPWGPKEEFYHSRNRASFFSVDRTSPSIGLIWALNISPQGRSFLLFLVFREFSIYCLDKKSSNEDRERSTVPKGLVR